MGANRRVIAPPLVPAMNPSKINTAWRDRKEKGGALRPVDLPPSMTSVLEGVSAALGVTFAVRGNASLPLYEDVSVPKPFTIKAKTSNQGFAAGLIPVDDAVLGKIENKTIKRYGPKDLEYDAEHVVTTPSLQHKQSLNSIMQGLNSSPPRYQLASDPAEIKQSGILRVIELDNNEVSKVIYSINLKDPNATPPIKIDRDKVRVSAEFKTAAPEWWDEVAFGKKWDAHANDRFPAFYQQGVEGEPKPLMVYGRDVTFPDSKIDRAPITGDQDLLWITVPASVKLEYKEAHTVLNTHKVVEGYDGPALMFKAILQLSGEMAKKNEALALNFETIDLKVLNKAIAGLGLVTPFEAYVAILVNQKIGNDIMHIRDFIQHGCENRNPGAPSSLEGVINHVGQGICHQTRTEKELVDFVSRFKPYQEQFIDVHPKWDKELWQPIVENQISLRAKHGYKSVADDVLNNFAIHPTVESPQENKSLRRS